MKASFTAFTVVALAALTAGSVAASPLLYIHDSAGRFGTVDVASGEATVLGNSGTTLTDIAFAPDGRLFGIDFTTLYQVDPGSGALTEINGHDVPGGNALVFDTDGTLYSAGSSSNNLFTINPETGLSTVVGDTGTSSAGDLAFNSGHFFMSSSNGNLVQIDPNTGSGDVVGSIGFTNVFGLATARTGPLYGLSGTDLITISVATGQGARIAASIGDRFSPIFGSSFVEEAVIPLPGAVMLFGTGLAGLAWIGRKCNKPTHQS